MLSFYSNRLADFYRHDVVAINPDFYTEHIPAARRICFVHATDGDIVTVVRSMTGRDIMYSNGLAGMVTLKERGNLFKFMFETGPVTFRDLSEEMMFWMEVNFVKEVRNPATGYYTDWTIQQAVDGLRNGDVDAVFTGKAFTDSQLINPSVLDYGYKFNNLEDGERVRLSMLTTLGQTARRLRYRC